MIIIYANWLKFNKKRQKAVNKNILKIFECHSSVSLFLNIFFNKKYDAFRKSFTLITRYYTFR